MKRIKIVGYIVISIAVIVFITSCKRKTALAVQYPDNGCQREDTILNVPSTLDGNTVFLVQYKPAKHKYCYLNNPDKVKSKKQMTFIRFVGE